MKLGIIGGSCFGLSGLFESAQAQKVTTVWGEPSCPLQAATLWEVPVVAMLRTGCAEPISVSQINFRANIQALKDAECTHILSTSSLASLQDEIHLGDFVIPDQFIDFTTQRQQTFENINNCNVNNLNPRVRDAMLDPFDENMREILVKSCLECQFPFYPAGTAITVEGPRFPNRAESRMFRAWGCDVTTMCLSTEAVLATELGIPFAFVGVVTDFDYWKDDEVPVSLETVGSTFRENACKLTTLLEKVIPKLGALRKSTML